MATSGPVVLVVEDDELNMMLCRDLLQVHGCSVIQASDGNTGLRMARERHPDLIILDIQLPGLSGVEVLTRLKADSNLRATPVIALTAFAMKGDKETFLRNGFDYYVSKPISVPDFLKSVECLMNIDLCPSFYCFEKMV